ncbi:hypothetical protein MPER_13032, partial [Moniliophthora perniciosa FA553]
RRSNAVSVSQSWAQAMSDTTGMTVTVILGGTPLRIGDSFQIESIHAGKNTNGTNWGQHDAKFHEEMTKSFFRFLQTCPGAELAPQKKKQRKGGDGGNRGDHNSEPGTSIPTSEKANCSSTSLRTQFVQERASPVPQGTGEHPLSSTDDLAKSSESSVPSAPQDRTPTSSSEAHRIVTKEGGPDRDPQRPKKPEKRPQPEKLPSRPKKTGGTVMLVSYAGSSSEGEVDGPGNLALPVDGPRRSQRRTRAGSPMDLDNVAAEDNSVTTSNSSTVTEACLPAVLMHAKDIIPEEDSAQWARDAFAVLSAGDALVQRPVWQHILHEYFTLQKLYSFANPDKYRLPSNLRPEEFPPWFKGGRKLDFLPNVRSVADFKRSLWEWWDSLNPDWRERIGEGRISRSRNGEWDGLRYPGQNGLVLPIVGLRWWFMCEEVEMGSDEWSEMAQDVLWVLESLVKWEKEHPDSSIPIGKATSSKPVSGAKRPPPSSSSRPPAKKARL